TSMIASIYSSFFWGVGTLQTTSQKYWPTHSGLMSTPTILIFRPSGLFRNANTVPAMPGAPAPVISTEIADFITLPPMFSSYSLPQSPCPISHHPALNLCPFRLGIAYTFQQCTRWLPAGVLLQKCAVDADIAIEG